MTDGRRRLILFMEDMFYAQAAFGFGIQPTAEYCCWLHYTGLFSRSRPTHSGVAVHFGKFASVVGRMGANLVARPARSLYAIPDAWRFDLTARLKTQLKTT